MKNNRTLFIVQSSLIAAVYATATYISSVFGIAYGPIQLRLSEALTVLSALTPAAIPGLTIGCIIGNISSPMGIWDIIFGSFATLFSAFLGWKLRKIKVKNIPVISILIPAIINGIIVGAQIMLFTGSREATLSAFIINALQIALSEIIVCTAGGIPVYFGMKKIIKTK